MRLLLGFLWVVASFAATTRQFSAYYLPSQTTQQLAADPAGNLFVVSTTEASIRVTKMDASGKVLATFDFGGTGEDSPGAAAVDPNGNLVIGGATASSDFPLVSPIQTTGSGFLTKLDPELTKIIYSTRLGTPVVNGVLNGVTAIAFDAAANVYVTGTAGPGMPVSPGALQAQAPNISVNAVVSHGFVAGIAAAGDKLLFSTYYTGGAAQCTNGCGGAFPIGGATFVQTVPRAIALDSSGAVVIAGSTDVNDVPVTGGAYAQQCGCLLQQNAGFVAKIGSGGSKLIWGTYLPLADASGYNGAGFDGVNIAAMTVEASGTILLAGATLRGFPITPDALQPTYPPTSRAVVTPSKAGFLARLDASGSQLLYSTYFGGNEVGRSPLLSRGVSGMSVDAQGTIWLTGVSASGALPAGAEAALGQDYVAWLSGDGRGVMALYTAPDGAAGGAIAVTPQGTVAALGYPNSLLIGRPSGGPSLFGIAGTPEYHVSPVIAPREVISIYGLGIGPANAQSAQVTNGVIGNTLGGVQVLFDGKPAALLYAGPTQINAIAPTAIAGHQSTAIEIVTPSGPIAGPTLTVQPTLPLVFADITGHATAINQDGTLNTPTNSAPAGTAVALWMTGAGAVAGSSDDQITTNLNDNPFPISVLSSANAVGGGLLSLEVLYGGDAPFLPSGVTQVNFRIPAIRPGSDGTLQFQIEAGPAISDFQYVYVK